MVREDGMTLAERFEELRALLPEALDEEWHEYDMHEAVIYMGSLLGLDAAFSMNLDFTLAELLEMRP
jgi:hypothetical protein